MPLPPPPLRLAATWLVPVFCCAIAILHAPASAQGGADNNAAKCDTVAQATEQAIIRILKIQKASLQPGLRRVEDLGASDQRLPSLTMALEDAFLVELPDALADGSGTTMKSYTDALDKALGCAARR